MHAYEDIVLVDFFIEYFVVYCNACSNIYITYSLHYARAIDEQEGTDNPIPSNHLKAVEKTPSLIKNWDTQDI